MDGTPAYVYGVSCKVSILTKDDSGIGISIDASDNIDGVSGETQVVHDARGRVWHGKSC